MLDVAWWTFVRQIVQYFDKSLSKRASYEFKLCSKPLICVHKLF